MNEVLTKKSTDLKSMLTQGVFIRSLNIAAELDLANYIKNDELSIDQLASLTNYSIRPTFSIDTPTCFPPNLRD